MPASSMPASSMRASSMPACSMLACSLCPSIPSNLKTYPTIYPRSPPNSDRPTSGVVAPE
ncbi:hypothetical protein NEUTE1DRAFT_117157 [Neurospora tetrasperma FGSC 2508]|uniref:Uncharacterized protein n=1 Tax=Neurospora tetrasperma (strain FGSC 2508 / ATCC MYA-4615 / P0657) TaxID=510951 RepID=F8MLD6_NEUT8|nr:uncharacterized protein NEUTE1DRAFT_117157 [Neurospora tetrasperma FGSC 2508]EGO58409.1 hypothetical protein NEUTE1DRAFT_117157 [Neurospora tetrasperma FGSC 2508]EGZ71258.1 hypothetical protein NEUTE2DRAFT_144452 [Neurospora tetrasperma FGSC 2509]